MIFFSSLNLTLGLLLNANCLFFFLNELSHVRILWKFLNRKLRFLQILEARNLDFKSSLDGLEGLILLKWAYHPKQYTDLMQPLSKYP